MKYIKYSDYVKKLGITQPKRDFQGSADTTLEDATDNTLTLENTTDDTSNEVKNEEQTEENATNNTSTLENTTDNASDEVKNEEQENTKTEEDSSN